MIHLSGHQSTCHSTCPFLFYLLFHSCVCRSAAIHQLWHARLSHLRLLIAHLLSVCWYTYQSNFLFIFCAFIIFSSTHPAPLYTPIHSFSTHSTIPRLATPLTIYPCICSLICSPALSPTSPHSGTQGPHPFFRGSLTHVLVPWKSNRYWTRPVIVSIAQCPHRDAEGLPYWVQCVFHNLCLVADGEPGGRQETVKFLGVALRPLPTEDPKISHSLSIDLIP